MHGYKGFINDASNAFEWLIQEYSGVVAGKVDPDFGEYAVQIKFRRCIISFDLDRMDLQGKFVNPTTNEIYHISNVLSLLKAEEVPYPSNLDQISTIRALLTEYALAIQVHLQSVLKGDFSWHSAYREEEAREAKLMAKVWKLPYESPIKQKFWSGDPSWKEDIKKLKK